MKAAKDGWEHESTALSHDAAASGEAAAAEEDKSLAECDVTFLTRVLGDGRVYDDHTTWKVFLPKPRAMVMYFPARAGPAEASIIDALLPPTCNVETFTLGTPSERLLFRSAIRALLLRHHRAGPKAS